MSPFLKSLVFAVCLFAALEAKAQSPAPSTPASEKPPMAAEKNAGLEEHLQPKGRRDPFRPFTLNVRPTVQRRENLSPLERYDLGQLKVVGIIWNLKDPTAMVEDSAGLGYVVKVGTPIGANGGTIKAIKQNEIVIEEFFMDLYGVRKRRDVSLRVSVEKME